MEYTMGCEHSRKRKLYMDEKRKQSYIVQARPSRDTRPELTDEHKRIVKETWTIVKLDIARVGVVLFMRLFEKYPDVKQLFVHFRGLTTEELRNNDRLRDHGLRVMNTVDKCVARIDQPDKLEKLLYELGQKHVIYNIKMEFLDYINTVDKCVARIDQPDKLEKLLYELGQKHVIYNIKMEFIDLIVPQLQQAIIPVLGDKWTYLVESAWSSFLRYIIHLMSEAMVL